MKGKSDVWGRGQAETLDLVYGLSPALIFFHGNSQELIFQATGEQISVTLASLINLQQTKC